MRLFCSKPPSKCAVITPFKCAVIFGWYFWQLRSSLELYQFFVRTNKCSCFFFLSSYRVFTKPLWKMIPTLVPVCIISHVIMPDRGSSDQMLIWMAVDHQPSYYAWPWIIRSDVNMTGRGSSDNKMLICLAVACDQHVHMPGRGMCHLLWHYYLFVTNSDASWLRSVT